MSNLLSRGGTAACLAALLACLTTGCGDAGDKGKTDGYGKDKTVAKADGPRDGQPESGPTDQVKGKKAHDHSGWWCDEHGIPEAECSMCSSKVAKEMKAKGDWCDKHDRGKSQCFICDPSLKEKFAAQYRAKYGKEPPPVEEEGEKKEVEKKDDGKAKDAEKKDEKKGDKK